MIDSDTGLALSVGCTVLLVLLTTLNLLAGNYLLAAFNLATVALGLWVIVRWVEIREKRRWLRH